MSGSIVESDDGGFQHCQKVSTARGLTAWRLTASSWVTDRWNKKNSTILYNTKLSKPQAGERNISQIIMIKKCFFRPYSFISLKWYLQYSHLPATVLLKIKLVLYNSVNKNNKKHHSLWTDTLQAKAVLHLHFSSVNTYKESNNWNNKLYKNGASASYTF